MDKKSYKLKYKAYKKGEKGNAYDLGIYLYENKKYKKAFIFLNEFMNLKYTYPQTDLVIEALADCHMNGLGTPKNIDKAMKLYQRLHHPKAYAILARYYYDKGQNEEALYYVKKFENNEAAIRFCLKYTNYNEDKIKYMKILIDKYHDDKLEKSLGVLYYEMEKYPQAYEILKKYEDNSDVKLYLGKMYFYGFHLKVDKNKAYDYFLNASSCEALAYLGDYYRAGIIVERDLEKAKRYYKNSCVAYGEFRLAQMEKEATNSSNPQLDKKLVDLTFNLGEAACYLAEIARLKKPFYYVIDRNNMIKKAISLKVVDGYVERGYEYLEQKQYKKAFEDFNYAYHHAANKAIIPLIRCYKEGLGVEINLDKVQELLALEASLDSDDTYQKAMMLLEDNKISDGISLLESISSENHQAQYDLAMMYLKGNYVQKNPKSAFMLLSNAQNTLPKAKIEYLKCLYYGIGVKADKVKALKLMSKLEHSDGEVLYIIGSEYESGIIYEKSYPEAQKYYQKASKLHFSKAMKALNELEKKTQALRITQAKITTEKKLQEAKEAEIKKVLAEKENAIMMEAYKKYLNDKINIAPLKFTFNTSDKIFANGTLEFKEAINYEKRNIDIMITGSVNLSIASPEKRKTFEHDVTSYAEAKAKEYLKKHPNFPFSITINPHYEMRYEW